MRFLNTRTLELATPSRRNQAGEVEPYAILSHRWAENPDEEVLFSDMMIGQFSIKPASSKVQMACQKAREHGLNWIWIDTCCIDKASSAELSQAINSMFKWYKDAKRCYVYLQDVPSKEFHESEWFTRGWTLQELLAPSNTEFFDCKWDSLGTEETLAEEISKRTGIPTKALLGGSLEEYCIAQKMSWAAGRKTTAEEDIAYCLLGIFDVNMSLRYGEGEKKAFIRLQEMIIKDQDDHSIFAWDMRPHEPISGLLAPHPSYFAGKQSVLPLHRFGTSHEPFSITNRGLSIKLQITPWNADTYLAFIDSYHHYGNGASDALCLFLRRLRDNDQYVRVYHKQNSDLLALVAKVNRRCDDAHVPKPAALRSLRIRNNPSQENICFARRRTWGFIIPSALLHAPGNSNSYLFIPPTDPTGTDLLPLTHLQTGLPFKQVVLGFTFELEPFCLLMDSWRDASQAPTLDGNPDGFHKFLLEEQNRVIVPRKQHDGIWRLKGSRGYESLTTGLALDVALLHDWNGIGPVVKLQWRDPGLLHFSIE